MNESTKQTATVDDGISMYLSFESTMSESTYKTISRDNIEVSESIEQDADSHGNKTLEPDSETIKEVSTQMAIPLRLKSAQKTCGYSSTPCKDELATNSRHNGAGDAKRNMDLGAVFADFEENNKENEQRNFSEDTMPSFSKTSILEIQKKNEQSASRIMQTKQLESVYRVEAGEDSQPQNVGVTFEKTTEKKVRMQYDCEPDLEHNHAAPILSPKKERQSIMKLINSVEDKKKTPRSARSKIGRKSEYGCEPDLIKNRPSRIGSPKKSAIAAKIIWKSDSQTNHGSSNDEVAAAAAHSKYNVTEETDSAVRELNKRKIVAFSRKSMMPPKSIDPIHKSRTPRKQRASIAPVVKTTFNSMTRKSIAPSSDLPAKRTSVLLLNSKLALPNGSRKSSSTVPPVRQRFIGGGGDSTTKQTGISTVDCLPQTKRLERPSAPTHICPDCNAAYHVKALLDAHKRTHHVKSPDQAKKSPLASQHHAYTANVASTSNANAASIHVCKHCDKTFALERALHIHLLEHCMKIPAAERRKLNFTEMNHVEKAETPHFRVTVKKPQTETVKNQLYHMPVRKSPEKTKIADEKKFIPAAVELTKKHLVAESMANMNARAQKKMGPPLSTKVKKKTAYTGISRTPTKYIHCRSCKKAFTNIIDYTNHMMTMHASLATSDDPAGGDTTTA